MVQMTFEEVKSEMQRRKTKRDDLLAAFEREGELTTGQVFNIAGSGASSRLKELKRKGHRIAARPSSKPGQWLYMYLGNRNDDDQTNVNLID